MRGGGSRPLLDNVQKKDAYFFMASLSRRPPPPSRFPPPSPPPPPPQCFFYFFLYSFNLLMHTLAICTFYQSMDCLFNDPYNTHTEAAIRFKGSLELISMQIFQTLLKYNMQKRRLNSSVNPKSSLNTYLEVETLVLSLLLLHVTNTNPLDFS